ncbi:hypothetical protein ACH5RR_013459 [Cinchona calisaya]|uniref:Uncharacterized protein n=1 Tax=Cinchona calisaya TaxID=153742 RepID=A0ABD3A072_9GENT
MGEDHVASLCPSDRAVEQAIVALKKGAHLLKYGRRGKPKFCPFRLSMDEKSLIWYSGQMEKQLKLSSVTNIIRGQNTKQLQPERESQSFSLIYANGERSLDLICKDKAQADCWFLGLKAIISRSYHRRLFGTSKNQRWAQSCANSPASYMRRKQILGLPEETAKESQFPSINGSSTQSFSERCFSDGLSCSSDSFYSESSLSSTHNVADNFTPSSPYFGPDDLNKKEVASTNIENRMHSLIQLGRPPRGFSQLGTDVLRDLLIWGEGVEGGCLSGGEVQCDALIPKVLDSTMMLDVQSVSLGRKHAALVTRQGEVFCWGEGKRGRLGHKIDIDTEHPKTVDSLTAVFVKSVSCGEYQTSALTDSGELYTWGDIGCSTDSSGEDKRKSHWLPHRLFGSLDSVSIVNVACGEWHMAIVSSDGQLFTCGDGTFGVLGHGNVQSISQPKEVESLVGLLVKYVACGPWHTAAVVEVMTDCFKIKRKGGKLFTWGDGDKGRLGHSDQERKLLPTCVTELVDHNFVQVACGSMITVGLTNMGKVYAMGSAVHGQLGNPHARDKSITIVQGKLKDEYVKEISVGSYHTAALTSRSNVFTWGKGANGQLGLGDTRDRNSPTLVEALRDRQVEHIACGSSSTAAICLHKSVATSDQSACKGCGTAFGFTRKKHNCYNCGLLFCRACCGKKATNASLAPTKVKPFRVCDPCFKKLQRIADSDGLHKFDAQSPRPLLTSLKAIPDGKDVRGDGNGAWSRMKLTINYSEEKIQGDNQQPLDSSSSLLGGLERWGQVPCPQAFIIDCRDQIFLNLSSISPLRTQLSSSSPAYFQDLPLVVKSASFASMNQKDSSQSDKFLLEEAQELRTQAESLKKLCQTREEEIQECRQKIEEAWEIAKEEAAKTKAAKEVIKALTSRLHTMTQKFSAERGSKDEAGVKKITSTFADNLDVKNGSQVVASCEPPGVGQKEDRRIDSLCNSPIIFSNTLKYLRDRDYNGDAASVEKSRTEKVDPGQLGIKSLKLEWVEQCQPGVYITLTTLPNGQKVLRRVRFSRKKFTEIEAERWWDENQLLVHKKYEIEEYTSSNQGLMVL